MYKRQKVNSVMEPREHRKKGRPKKILIEGIRRSMSDRGLSDENCNNRQQWRLGIGQRHKMV